MFVTSSVALNTPNHSKGFDFFEYWIVRITIVVFLSPPQTTKQVRAPIFFRKNDFLRATKIHAGRGTQVRRVMQSVSSSPDMNTMHLF